MLTVTQAPLEEDFTLYLNGESTTVSKMLFASYSKKLREDLQANAKIDHYDISLPVSIDTVREFCKACQMRPYDMNQENVPEFLELARAYGCDAVVEACEAFLPTILVRQAIVEGEGDAEDRLVERIREYLDTEYLLDMSDDQVVRVLGKARKRSLGDADIIQFVLSYARKKKGCDVGRALESVDLRSLSSRDLDECIRLGQFPKRVNGEDAFNLLNESIGPGQSMGPMNDAESKLAIDRVDEMTGRRSVELWNELQTVVSALAWQKDPYDSPSDGLFSQWSKNGELEQKLEVCVPENGDREKLFGVLKGESDYTQEARNDSDNSIRFHFKVPVYIGWVSLTSTTKSCCEFEFTPLQYIDSRDEVCGGYIRTKKLREYEKPEQLKDLESTWSGATDPEPTTSIFDLREYKVVTKNLVFRQYREGEDKPGNITFDEFEIKGIELPELGTQEASTSNT